MEADGPPILTSNGTLTLSLFKRHGDVKIAPTVEILYDPTPRPKTPEQIDALDSYCIGGGFSTNCGDSMARIIKPAPPGSYYSNLPGNTVIADDWMETENSFSFSASMGDLVDRPGVYTVIVWRDSGSNRHSETLVTLSAVWQG